MDYLEIIRRDTQLIPRNIRPKQKVLLVRKAKDNVLRAHLGTVNFLRVTGRAVISINVTELFEDGIKKHIKSKDIEFALDTNVTVYLAEDTTSASSASAKEDLINRRKLYAQNRAAFKGQRAISIDQFGLVGLTPNSTLEEYSKAKKKLMLKWHPDRMVQSDLSPENFKIKSKEATDALSFVEEFLNKKYSR